MLSQLVVLFTLLVVQAHSEQLKCDVVPFETNDVRGSCCIYPKHNFNRPSLEEITGQLQEQFNERGTQTHAKSPQRHSKRNGQNPDYDTTDIRHRINPVTENSNSYDSSSAKVPFIDPNRRTKTYPSVAHQETNHKNSGTRDYTVNNQPRENTGYNPRSEHFNGGYNTKSGRPLSGDGRNETPELGIVERTFPKVDKPKNQEKTDRSIFQSKNGSTYNSINRTGEDNSYEKNTPQPQNTVPDIGNRNNVNVPDTCTAGFAKNKNGECVKIYT